jgi:hypothetical protein
MKTNGIKVNDIVEVLVDTWFRPEVYSEDEFNLPKGARLIVTHTTLDSRGIFYATRLAQNEVDLLNSRTWYLYPSEVEVVGHYL